MSHTLNLDLEIKDRDALKRATEILGIKAEEGTHQLYNSEETGTGLFLKDWKYPAVVKNDGSVSYDNYEGKWGNVIELNKFKARYGVEKAKIEARKKGYSVYESYDENAQEIQLKIAVGQ